MGFIVAIFVYFYPTFMNTVIGLIIGYLFGNILYNFTLKIFSMNPVTLYWVTILFCMIVVMIFAVSFESMISIVATSLLGAYTAVRVYTKITSLGTLNHFRTVPR